MIRAETWRAIVEENLDGDSNADTITSNTNHNYNDSNQGDLTPTDEDDGAQNDFDVLSDQRRRHSLKLSFDTDQLGQSVSDEDLNLHVLPSQSDNSFSVSSLPRINSLSNSSQRQSMQSMQSSIQSDSNSQSFDCMSPPTNLRESSSVTIDSVRLPKIASNSFLIHTRQGFNNNNQQKMANTSSPFQNRPQPPKMLHNDLSGMSLKSFSEDEVRVSASQDKPVRKMNSTAIPHPPSGSKSKEGNKS